MTDDTSLEPFALGVGQLCQAWAELETSVMFVLRLVAQMPDTTATQTIIRSFDFRDQLAAVKVGAHYLEVDQRWKDAVFESVDYIDNVLRNRRNRYVHDYWLPDFDGKGVMRVQHVHKWEKPQARQPIRLKTQQSARETIEDLNATITEVTDHSDYLSELYCAINQQDGELLAETLSKPPQRLFPRRREETPSPKGS